MIQESSVDSDPIASRRGRALTRAHDSSRPAEGRYDRSVNEPARERGSCRQRTRHGRKQLAKALQAVGSAVPPRRPRGRLQCHVGLQPAARRHVHAIGQHIHVQAVSVESHVRRTQLDPEERWRDDAYGHMQEDALNHAWMEPAGPRPRERGRISCSHHQRGHMYMNSIET